MKIMKRKKQKLQYTIKAIILTETGEIHFDKIAIKSKNKNVISIKIQKSGKELNIYENFIRKNKVLLSSVKGNIKPIDPVVWNTIDLKKQKIDIVNYNLQNFRAQESRSALYRWAVGQDLIQKLTPWFKLLVVCLVVGVIGWFALKIGFEIFTRAIAPRLADCASILPTAPTPPGVS